MILIAIFMVLIVITACSVNEEEHNEYADEYINFNYPADWDLRVNESQNYKQIFFEENADFHFVVEVEEIKEVKNNDKLREKIEKELSGGYKLAEETISIGIISYKETSIGGEWAKELSLEINLVNNEIEQLYGLLDRGLLHFNEIKAYLEEYTGVEDFINEIKYNPEKLVELKAILSILEVDSEKEKSHTMFANAMINNINHFIREDNSSIYRQYSIISHKENVRLNIFFQSHEEDIKRKGIIKQIVESITFTNDDK